MISMYPDAPLTPESVLAFKSNFDSYLQIEYEADPILLRSLKDKSNQALSDLKLMRMLTYLIRRPIDFMWVTNRSHNYPTDPSTNLELHKIPQFPLIMELIIGESVGPVGSKKIGI